MSFGYMRNPGAMYQQESARGRVEDADPHQLTMLLLDTLIERINTARKQLQQRDLAGKANNVARAVNIVNELRSSLDHKAGAQLSGRLEALYEYVSRRLLHAQARNDEAALEESVRLMSPIRDAWRAIRPNYLASVK